MNAPIGSMMTRSVVRVCEHFSVATLEELLLERNLSGVPVVDDDQKLVGFAAMTDIVRYLHDRENTGEASADAGAGLGWGFHEEPEPTTVAHLMAPIAFELRESCPVAKAVSLMAMQHVHRIPVVSDDGELVGIVTSGDIVRYLARAGRAASDPAKADVADDRDAAERECLTEADRLMSLGFLTGGVAHEINNALTPMRLSLGRLISFELSRRPLGAERLHRIELLQDVREGVARIERVIRELKAFSHVDDSERRPVDIAALVEVAIGQAAHEIRHHARLVCEYSSVPSVRARPAELRQVLLNLLVNAAQAIPLGEAHLNEILVVTRTDDHGCAVIEIKDTGTGIAPEMLSRIFEPFFTTRSEGRLGLGLGLAMSRDIVAALDGEITIESEVGMGTTVRVVLPPCDEISAAINEAPPDHTEHDVRRRILIVDDDRPVAAAIAFELGTHDVVVAESGREALEILRRDKNFDVILCDLMMPEISGMDVYESLRLVDPALLGRVVLMTGGAFTTRAGQFLSEVAAPMIEKPFYPGQLHAIVNTLEHRREVVGPRNTDGAVDEGERRRDHRDAARRE